MIHYDNKSWFGLVFRFKGTVWPAAFWPVVALFLISCVVFFSEFTGNLEELRAGHTIFASTMSYLLIFRANTASERYWLSRTYLTQAFAGVRDLVMTMCIDMKGGAAAARTRRAKRVLCGNEEDANDIRASMARVNCVRLAVAWVVSLKLHTRICYNGYVRGVVDAETKRQIDVDRIRLRGLMTRTEFEEMNDLVPIDNETHITNGSSFLTRTLIDNILERSLDEEYEVDMTPDMRQPSAILMLIRLEIIKHTNEPYGVRDRFAKDTMSIIHNLGICFEYISMVKTTPIPFPYVHLCKFLLLCFLLTVPATLDYEVGFFTSVVLEACAALSLLGIDSIAIELADPWGEDSNDLDVIGLIAQFEKECMEFLTLCGDSRGQSAFDTFAFSDGGLAEEVAGFSEFLCLASQVECKAGSWEEPATSRSKRDGATLVHKSLDARGKRGRPDSVEENHSGQDAPRTDAKIGFLAGSEGNSQSQVHFLPMQNLESYGSVHLAGVEEHAFDTDNVGLSEDEVESPTFKPIGREMAASSSPRKDTGRRRPMLEGDSANSMSARFAPLVEEASLSTKGSPLAKLAPLPEEARGSQSARGVFRPMEEMGTQTIVFEDGEMIKDDQELIDVVGLSLSDIEEVDAEPDRDEVPAQGNTEDGEGQKDNEDPDVIDLECLVDLDAGGDDSSGPGASSSANPSANPGASPNTSPAASFREG